MLAGTLPCVAAPLTPVIHRSGDAIGIMPLTSPSYMEKPGHAATADKVTVQVGVKTDNTREQELATLFAIPVGADSPAIYEATQAFGSFWNLEVPPGTYDVVASFYSDNNQTYILLFYENQSFEANASIIVNTNDAKLSTRIRHLSPNGEELVFPTRGAAGNCTTGDFWMMLRHHEYGNVFADEMATLGNVMGTISTNVVPEHYSMTRMDVMTWTEAPAYFVISVDMTIDVNEPTSDGWLSISGDFATTPVFKTFTELTKDEVPYTMAGYTVAADNFGYGFVSMGVTTLPCDTHSLVYWAPPGYEGAYEFYPVLRSNLLTYAESSISTMPLRRTETGFVPIGRNFIADGSLGAYADKRYATSNPRFSQLPSGFKYGNCTPALVCMPGRNGGFTFGYSGRFGEDMNIDAYNMAIDLEPSYIRDLGGQTYNVSVTCDGQTVCDGADSFVGWLEWPVSGTVEASVSTHNVLIDDAIPGTNTATLSFDASTCAIPTLTSLQVRDANDNPVDRISGKEGGFVELTAAVLTINKVSGYLYQYDYTRPAEVKLEYAPHGESAFTELELEEIPELFFMPGYGMCLRADIDDIKDEGDNRESGSKWYDLRVTVKGDGDATQTQTMSPAIMIDRTGTGISQPVSGTSVSSGPIYNLHGVQVSGNPSSLPAGLYIHNGKKIIIR